MRNMKGKVKEIQGVLRNMVALSMSITEIKGIMYAASHFVSNRNDLLLKTTRKKTDRKLELKCGKY